MYKNILQKQRTARLLQLLQRHVFCALGYEVDSQRRRVVAVGTAALQQVHNQSAALEIHSSIKKF